MPDIFEGALQVAKSAAAGAICEIIPKTLAAGTRPPQIREIGVFCQIPSGTSVATVGIGRPAAAGITPGTETTVQALDGFDTVAGGTLIAASWGTAPTTPGTFMRRPDIQGVAGAGVIFTWNADEFILWSGASVPTIVIWQISALAVTYDIYVKVRE